MVSVTIDSFKDRESMGIYELPEGSSVLDLKAEIEVTEGIPVGHQRLVYQKGEELQDNEDLDLLIHSLPFQPEPAIIRLLQAGIYLHLRILKRQDTVESYEIPDSQERIIHKNAYLDEPIRTNLSRWPREAGVDFSSVEIFLLNSVQAPRRILDINQTLSYYGISNGDAIRIVYNISENEALSNPSMKPRYLNSSYRGSKPWVGSRLGTVVLQAKYDWDGKIMHPFIKGLPLKRNALFKVDPISQQPGWLIGSPFNPSESLTSFWSQTKGYFPGIFVSPLEENSEDLEIAGDMLDIPPLPPFQFPPAKNMTFHMPFSDKGHSFLKMKVNYELLSSPVDPTHVTITLLCSTHDIRRVSSVSLFIETPETELSDVQVCENEAHREEIRVDKEVTESRSRQAHFDGVSIGTHGTTVGFQGGISKGHSIGSTEKGSRVSRRKVDAGVYNENTIFWNLKAPTTRLDEDGLTGEESITFILTHKPIRFKYKCRVTHSRGGVEKTTQRVSRA